MTWLGSQAPDPGSPEFPALVGFAIGVLATGVALALSLPRDEVEWFGLIGAFLGGALGFVAYLVGLTTDLY